MRFASIPLFVVLVSAAPVRSQQASDTGRARLVAQLDSLSRDFVSRGSAAGITVAVVRGSDTLLNKGVGERDRGRHLPATKETVYRIGSITKQFTAAAVMQLVEQGRVSLSDPLTTYLPQYPQWHSVTIRQLLNHTSGIHPYTSSAEWRKHWPEDLAPGALVAFVSKDTFDFVPGTRWQYNNTGYLLLGMVLEKVTGRPYAQYVAEHLFAPLGLRHAEYCPSRPTDDSYAAGYEDAGGTLVPATYLSMTHPYAAGALCMTVPDFLTWQAALTGARVVRPATFAVMSTSDTVASGLRTGYGFGLVSGRLGSHALVGHGGGIHGFSTESAWFPDDSLRVVVFTNTATSHPELLAANLASAVLGLPLRARPTMPPAVALALAERPKYVGTYDLITPTGRPFPIHVSLEGDALHVQADGPGQGRIPLIHLGGGVFGATFDPSLRVTITVGSGRGVKARLDQRGATMEGMRRP